MSDAESTASYQAQSSRKEGEESEVWVSHNTHTNSEEQNWTEMRQKIKLPEKRV